MIITFRGERRTLADENKVVFSVNGGLTWANLPLYLEEVNHSPTGFEWGYLGSGPSQLAYAILRVHCTLLYNDNTQDIPRQHYWEFKDAFIAGIRRDEWEIDSRLIDYWLNEGEERE